jgi:catechol 2,3-dioxygenase
MSTYPSSATPAAPAGLRCDRITYGAVHLDVVDLGRSLAFWRDLVGLGELPSLPGEVRLGVDGRALIVLRPDAVAPVGRGHAGLYHVAIHVPSAEEFARVLVRLAKAGVPQSPTDHVFSMATYVHDPDGIMLEITLETPERFGSVEIGQRSVSLFDNDGRRRSATEPLDVIAAVAPLGQGDADRPLPSGTYIGHVHLHVPELRASHRFYRDVIGFQEHAYMAPIGMSDLSAGGRFPHRIAINDWHGRNARQPAPGTAGLARFELVLRGEGQLVRLAERAASTGPAVASAEDGSVSLRDPAGNEVTVLEAAL